MGLFRKKNKNKKSQVLTSEKLILEQLKRDDDQFITSLARKLIEGSPLILNFDQLHVDSANKVISFISGVVFAIEGHIVEINETTYLFGDKNLYTDNSIEAWLKENLN